MEVRASVPGVEDGSAVDLLDIGRLGPEGDGELVVGGIGSQGLGHFVVHAVKLVSFAESASLVHGGASGEGAVIPGDGGVHGTGVGDFIELPVGNEVGIRLAKAFVGEIHAVRPLGEIGRFDDELLEGGGIGIGSAECHLVLSFGWRGAGEGIAGNGHPRGKAVGGIGKGAVGTCKLECPGFADTGLGHIRGDHFWCLGVEQRGVYLEWVFGWEVNGLVILVGKVTFDGFSLGLAQDTGEEYDFGDFALGILATGIVTANLEVGRVGVCVVRAIVIRGELDTIHPEVGQGIYFVVGLDVPDMEVPCSVPCPGVVDPSVGVVPADNAPMEAEEPVASITG